jgi:hypothetical protein
MGGVDAYTELYHSFHFLDEFFMRLLRTKVNFQVLLKWATSHVPFRETGPMYCLTVVHIFVTVAPFSFRNGNFTKKEKLNWINLNKH